MTPGRRPFSASVLVLIAAALASCKEKPAPLDAGDLPAAALGPQESLEPAWARAASLEPEDLAELAHREGTVGLIEGAAKGAQREMAVRALAFSEGLSALPFLAAENAVADPARARPAAEALLSVASRPRRADDPEDALEVREGCDRLLETAKGEKSAKAARTAAVSALRMLADRCGFPPREIPTTFDTR